MQNRFMYCQKSRANQRYLNIKEFVTLLTVIAADMLFRILLCTAEKLLSVGLQVIKTTGFMKGLFTDVEMNSDNVKVAITSIF